MGDDDPEYAGQQGAEETAVDAEEKKEEEQRDPLANFDEAFASEDEDGEDEDGDDDEEKRFLKACRQDKDVEARDLLEMFKNDDILDVVDRNGNTGAHYAAASGNVQLFKDIAERCPRIIDTENLDGRTPLSLAAASGSLAIVLWSQDLQRESVAQELRDRTYFACTSCGLCLNGRERLAARICAKNRDHKWEGTTPPRHILCARAADFSTAAARFKKDYNKEGPRPRGWWCKESLDPGDSAQPQ